MRKTTYIAYIVMSLITGMCLLSCSEHTEEAIDDKIEVSNADCIKIMIHVPDAADTRSNPQGGPEGDGNEDAVRHESEIKNIMAFVIRNADGINAPDGTEFIYKEYMQEGSKSWQPQSYGVNIILSPNSNETNVLFPSGSYTPTDGDRIIVIANMGNRTQSITNLGQLRDLTSYSSWRNGQTLKDNDLFVMTSAFDTDGIVHASTSSTAPYITTVRVQRTAARLDFMYNDTKNIANDDKTQLVYKVLTDPSYPESRIATVHLTHIIPVNLMQESSYAIKRVASALSPLSVTYCGAETVDANNLPTNYVIEPHTLFKESILSERSDIKDEAFNRWYGPTNARTITNAFAIGNPSSYLSKSTIASYMQTEASGVDLTFTHHITIAYANENTQSKDKQEPEFMTSFLLRAIYEPKTVYTDAAASQVYSNMTHFAKGRTFWRWMPSADPEEKDCKYFSNEEAAKAYQAVNHGDLEKFTNGICYYTINLHHASSTTIPYAPFPMEYCIVRNNIYRVGIETISKPGTPYPSLVQADYVTTRIFVRPWNKRTNSEIIL